MGNTLRAMSGAPAITNLMNQVRQQTRRYLEAGGATAPAPKRANPDPVPADFIVPKDIDADELAQAIEAKLHEHGGLVDQPILQRRAGDRVVVPATHLVRLGDGRFDKGRRFVQGVVNQIRGRRAQRPAKGR